MLKSTFAKNHHGSGMLAGIQTQATIRSSPYLPFTLYSSPFPSLNQATDSRQNCFHLFPINCFPSALCCAGVPVWLICDFYSFCQSFSVSPIHLQHRSFILTQPTATERARTNKWPIFLPSKTWPNPHSIPYALTVRHWAHKGPQSPELPGNGIMQMGATLEREWECFHLFLAELFFFHAAPSHTVAVV